MGKKYNVVYLTINKLNGKCYVGSHLTNNINDNYYGSGIYISNSLNKYKKENPVSYWKGKKRGKEFSELMSRKTKQNYIPVYHSENNELRKFR